MHVCYSTARHYSLLLLLLLLPFFAQATPPTATQLTAATTAFLQKFVDKDGAVDYAALHQHPQPLNDLLRDIAAFDAAHTPVADRAAFYLNAYNVLVIGAVVAHYPMVSVMDVPGFFNQQRRLVAGEQLTLDEVEHRRLRPLTNDPRLHFALVCGTVGCPRLSRTAYTGAHLSAQLTAQTRRMLQDPAYVHLDPADQSVALPEIFQWYTAAFGSGPATGLAYANSFRGGQPIPAAFAVSYYAHDWSLNEQHKATASVTAASAL